MLIQTYTIPITLPSIIAVSLYSGNSGVYGSSDDNDDDNDDDHCYNAGYEEGSTGLPPVYPSPSPSPFAASPIVPLDASFRMGPNVTP